MMRRTSLKLLGLLLAVLMTVGLLPLGSMSAQAEEPETEIPSAGLSLTLPEAGPTGAAEGQPVPAAAEVVSGEGFSLLRANWYRADGSVPTSFEAGQSYYAELELQPAEGYAFAESVQVTVDTAGVRSAQLQESGALLVRTEDITLAGEAAERGLWVGGVPVTETNQTDILGDGGSAVFDPATDTLTLKDPEIKGLHEESGALILATGMDLTVKGSAALELPEAILGICVNQGSLTLDGGFIIKATACALKAENNLIFEDGSVAAEISSGDNWAVKAGGNIVVKKAQLTAVGTAGGILAGSIFSLEEGVVKATATGLECSEETEVFGLLAQETVEIKGGDLTAKGGDAGIRGAKGIVFAGGIIQAEGTNCGISVLEGTLTIRDTTKRVTADGQGENGAIFAPEIVLGSALTVTEPAGGVLGADKRHITEADGSTVAKHAVIESSLVTYKVSFETFGGPEIPSQTVAEGKTAEKPEDPKLEGFSFKGWYVDPEKDEAPFDFSTPITEDLTLQAYWLGSVTVSVADMDGNAGVGGLVSLGGDDYRTSFTAEFWRDGGLYWVGCKAESGYRFDHWEDGEGKTVEGAGESFTFSLTDGPKTFVAVFAEGAVYFITLDSNGGDPAYLTMDTDEEGRLDPDELEKLESVFTREGYDFNGWSLVPNGKPLDVSSYVFTSDETLYVLWARHYYTVEFESNGGSEVPAQSVAYGDTAMEPADPTKAGNIFGGWFIDEDLTEEFDFSTPITEDLLLFAKWDQVVKYTVVSGGGSIYGKTSGNELKITVKRTPKDSECYNHFTGVKIDGGEIIRGTDYTAEPGSTIITLKPSYLSTLNSGSHIITITFDDGKATTGLTVKAGSGGSASKRSGTKGNTSPETGDPGSPLLWTGLLVCSAAGLGAVSLGSRKYRRLRRS